MPWWWALVTFVCGSGGTFTIIWWLFQRRINKADAAKAEERKRAEKKTAERADHVQREWLLVKDYRQSLGRFLFWFHTEVRGMMETTGHKPINGHLVASWEKFQEAENALKAFENEQAAARQKDMEVPL